MKLTVYKYILSGICMENLKKETKFFLFNIFIFLQKMCQKVITILECK